MPRKHNMSLFEETLALLKNRPKELTIEVIASNTKLSVWWLMKLANGKIKEPSVVKIETLYSYLSKRA